MTDAELGAPREQPSGFSLALNFLPLLHILSGAILSLLTFDTTLARLGCAVVWLFLLPPVLGRLCIAAFGRPQGRLSQHMTGYRVWWVLTQLQTPFNRLPWLEELLRLVPGLYAAWIALWGGRLSPFAYVGPGVIITDRYSVTVGRGAVLGFGSALAGHMALRDEQGRWLVVVATPIVEPEGIVGGGAGLGPGAVLRAGHMLPAGRRVGPFEIWPRRSGSAS